ARDAGLFEEEQLVVKARARDDPGVRRIGAGGEQDASLVERLYPGEELRPDGMAARELRLGPSTRERAGAKAADDGRRQQVQVGVSLPARRVAEQLRMHRDQGEVDGHTAARKLRNELAHGLRPRVEPLEPFDASEQPHGHAVRVEKQVARPWSSVLQAVDAQGRRLHPRRRLEVADDSESWS